MRRNKILLSQRYVIALRNHLKQAVRASLQAAVRLGHEAVALGLETLELARIHERALATIRLSNHQHGLNKRAQTFFTEANSPIEQTHRASRQSKIDFSRLNETLGHRTEELAASKRELQNDVVRRKVMEVAHEESGRRHDKSLEESLKLQNRLRQLTHKVLAAQEDERKKISHELQDEIAQTLLGINVRLLSLKQGDIRNINSLKNEIASTQRLVVRSAKSVRRFARELDVHHPA